MSWMEVKEGWCWVHSNGTRVCRVVINGADTFEVWPPGAKLFTRRYRTEANAKRSVDQPRKAA